MLRDRELNICRLYFRSPAVRNYGSFTTPCATVTTRSLSPFSSTFRDTFLPYISYLSETNGSGKYFRHVLCPGPIRWIRRAATVHQYCQFPLPSRCYEQIGASARSGDMKALAALTHRHPPSSV